MGRSFDSQGRYFKKLGDGTIGFLNWFSQIETPAVDEPSEATVQMLDQALALLDNPDTMKRLAGMNVSMVPGDDAPIRVFDLTGPTAGTTASPVGLMMEIYREAVAQPLPLGGFDAPDRHLRGSQARWVSRFQDDLNSTARTVYGRNRRDQYRVIRATWAMVLAATAGAWCGGTAALAISAAASLSGTIAMQIVSATNRRDVGEALKDFRARLEVASAGVDKLTHQRQDNLVALIHALFDSIGHLREDVVEIELSDRTAGHLHLIFALYGLLRNNRKCTRIHTRMMGMVREGRGIQRLDEALMWRRKINDLTNISYPRILRRLHWLCAAGMLPLLPVAMAVAPHWLPSPRLDTGLATGAMAIAGIAFAWIKVLDLHSHTDDLISRAQLTELCAEDSLDAVAGAADVQLEVCVSRTTGRLMVRLLREEQKRR